MDYRPWTVQNTDWVLVVPKGRVQSCKLSAASGAYVTSVILLDHEHTGKIREFIWKQHPFGIMIVYSVSVKAFVSLHMVIR